MANTVTSGAGKQSKYILRQFPIIRFYAALALSLVYFVVQLVVAHVAHSLILQIDAYHMLYNILALTVCIVTAKVSKQGNNLTNTFGWRRIDVCGAVANLCFLSALGFSVVVECIQAIVHAAHHKAMLLPVLVGVVGVLGLVVNLVIFFLIGGYTLHQSGFLCSTKDGRGEDSVISEAMRRGPYEHVMRERQGAFELFRDFFGCVLVVGVSVVVFYFGNDAYTEYVDPCVTILTVLTLGLTSYRYAMEAGEILLLTIPNNMDVANLQTQLKEKFAEVFDIHEFHVWQLTPARIIATLHIVLQKPQGYLSIQNKIIHFLHENGISHVTLQPEFLQMTEEENVENLQSLRLRKCFIPCRGNDDKDCHCHDKQCCRDEDEHDHDHDEDDDDGHGHSHNHGGNSSQFESTSFNSFANVQSLSSVGGGLGCSSRLKSESLNNHLDISLDSINISNRKDSHGGATSVNISNNGSGFGGAILGGDTESDEDDDEQGRAELRPMI